MDKKIGLLLLLLAFIFQTGTAQKRERNVLRKPLQQAINKQLDKEREVVRIHLDSIQEMADIHFSNEDMLIAQRIQRMQKTIPLEYNHLVKAYLDKYVSRNYQPYMERLLGLSQYYFPIYEQIFSEHQVPEEIKYLSVVESSLDPHTLSSAGALGPWQFIYGTAKGYNLTMDGFIDERKDVYLSTQAVVRYLTDAYGEFDDWLLAVASYNCGRGCVRRAIQRSGMVNPTFWELSPYLPQQTRNYIPKYIAMSYVLEYADEHQLRPQATELASAYKVFMIDKQVDMQRVAQAVDCPMEVLEAYNPAFKKHQVNGTVSHPKRLVVPVRSAFSDSLLYTALHEQVVLPQPDRDSWQQHIVKSGETLTGIAKSYEVTVAQLLAWNGLSAKSVTAGKTLRIQKAAEEAVDTRLAKNVTKAKAATAIAASATRAAYVTHTVKRGDTLTGIASQYKGASVNRLKTDNNIKSNHLSVGQKIKVFCGSV